MSVIASAAHVCVLGRLPEECTPASPRLTVSRHSSFRTLTRILVAFTTAYRRRYPFLRLFCVCCRCRFDSHFFLVFPVMGFALLSPPSLPLCAQPPSAALARTQVPHLSLFHSLSSCVAAASVLHSSCRLLSILFSSLNASAVKRQKHVRTRTPLKKKGRGSVGQSPSCAR